MFAMSNKEKLAVLFKEILAHLGEGSCIDLGARFLLWSPYTDIPWHSLTYP